MRQQTGRMRQDGWMGSVGFYVLCLAFIEPNAAEISKRNREELNLIKINNEPKIRPTLDVNS